VARLIVLDTTVLVDHVRGSEAARAYLHGLRVADLMIAATADGVDGDLATSNVRDFPMFKGLRSPY
jgi:predicted nucleic acid-binding protein